MLKWRGILSTKFKQFADRASAQCCRESASSLIESDCLILSRHKSFKAVEFNLNKSVFNDCAMVQACITPQLPQSWGQYVPTWDAGAFCIFTSVMVFASGVNAAMGCGFVCQVCELVCQTFYFGNGIMPHGSQVSDRQNSQQQMHVGLASSR